MCSFAFKFLKKATKEKQKKSHTCEEGGVHLIISVWHLLMNLKSNNLLENVRILMFTMVNFFLKKEKHLKISSFFTCVPKVIVL